VSLGTLAVPHAATAPELEEIRELVAELGIASLLALPLSDGEDQVGVLLLMQTRYAVGTRAMSSCSKPSVSRL